MQTWTSDLSDPPESRHEVLCQELWSVITTLKTGDRFLSVRDIIRRYGVSQGTATKALDRFCREGLLRRRPNHGFTVGGEFPAVPQAKKRMFLVLAPDWPSADCALLRRTVAETGARDDRDHLHLIEYPTGEGIPAKLPLIGNDADGVIVLPASGVTLTEARHLASYDKPVVVLGCDLTGMGISSVSVDNSLAGNMAAHHLWQLGHRRIGVVISEPHNRTIMDRARGVQNYLSLQAGATCEIIDCRIENGDPATEKTYQRFQERLNQPFDLTAVVSVSMDPTRGILSACANRGLRVPDDLSVIGIGSSVKAESFSPPLTTVAVHFDRQAERAISLMGDGPEKIDAGRCYPISPSLIERASSVALGIRP